MKILYISFSYSLNSGVNANRVFEVAKLLSKKGIEVTLITPQKAFNIANIENLVVSPSIKSPGSLSLFYSNVVKAMFSAPDSLQESKWTEDVKDFLTLNQQKLGNFDIIYINTHPISLIKTGIFAKNLFQAKLVVDFQDTFYFNPYKKNFKLMDPVIRMQEKSYMEKIDALITNQPSAQKVYSKFYPNLQVFCIPNIMPSGMPAPKKHNLKKQPKLILYGGSLYIGRDLFPLLEAITKSKSNFEIEVLGSFSKLNQFRYRKYPEIKWSGKVKPEQYYKYLNDRVDVSVVLQSFNIVDTGASAIASKTFEYLYLNKPIIYIGPDGDNVDFIKKYSNNYFIMTNPKNGLKSLVEFLDNLVYKEVNTKEIFYKEYTTEKVLGPLVGILKDLIKD